MITYTRNNWPANAPDFYTPEGWEYQKRLQLANLKTEISTIPWLINSANNMIMRAEATDADYYFAELKMRLAARLAEIVNHPDAAHFRAEIDASDFVKQALESLN